MSNTTSIYPLSFIDRTKVHTLLYVLAGSLFLALCAQIRIPLPFTPIPITLQTFAVMLLAAQLGKRLAPLSVLLYLAEALLGLPVLPAAVVQPWILFSPKGGYYLGFAIQAYLCGQLFARKDQIGSGLLFAGLLLASTVQLICGGLWFSCFFGWSNTFAMSIAPFIPGELLKVTAISLYKKKIMDTMDTIDGNGR